MDVVTLGAVLVGVALSVASYFIFQWATRENEMSELNPATMRLFADEKAAKAKGKPAVKPKKVSAAKVGSSKEKTSGSVTDEPISAAAPVESVTSSASSTSGSISKVGTKREALAESNKPTRPLPSASPPSEEVVVQVVRSFNANEDSTTKTKGSKARGGGRHSKPAGYAKGHDEEANDGDGPTAATKWEPVGKQPPQRASPPAVSAPTASAKASQSAPKPISEPISSTSTQLAKALEEGGPETSHYVALFEKYQAEVKAKEAELKKEAAAQQSMTRRLDAIQAENTKLRTDLQQQSDKYATFEKTVQQKMAETLKLREENGRLTATLTANHHKVQQCQQLLHEVEILKQELKHKAHSESAEIGEAKLLVDKLQDENADLKSAYREAMTSKSQAESSLKKAEEAQAEELKKQVKTLNHELDRAMVAFNEAKMAHIVQTKERDVLKAQAKKLQSEVDQWKRSFKDAESKMEHSNQQLTEMALMVDKLREAEALSNSFRERCTRLEGDKEQLEKKLAASAAMLAAGMEHQQQQKGAGTVDAGKLNGGSGSAVEEEEVMLKRNRDLEAEITRLSDELASAKQRNHVVEPVVQLQKTGHLNATPAGNAGLASNAELEEHKRRNQALREANHKLIEAVQAQEALAKRLVTEMEAKTQSSFKELMAVTQQSLQRTLPEKGKAPALKAPQCSWPIDVDSYARWIEEALSRSVDGAATQASAHKPSPKPASTASNAETGKQLQDYKRALWSVNQQLAIVQTAAEEMERDYSQRVAQLEKQLLAR